MGLFNKTTLVNAFKSLIYVAGVIATFLGIYSSLQEKKPEIEFQILSDFSVINLNTDLSKLDIIYDKTSLKSLRVDLRVMYIRIENTGNENILGTFYDPKEPLGFTVVDGQIIEKPEIIGYSSKYLQKDSNPTLVNNNKVVFSKVIIEEAEYFTVRLLILHPNGKLPHIVPSGKVAGVKKMSVINLSLEENEKSIWWRIISGDVYIQALRILFYGIILITLIFLGIIVGTWVSSLKEEYYRKKSIGDFKKVYKVSENPNNKLIFSAYTGLGGTHLLNMQRLISSQGMLTNSYNSYMGIGKNYPGLNARYSFMIKQLVDNNLIKSLNNEAVVEKSFATYLKDFIDFLKATEKIKPV